MNQIDRVITISIGANRRSTNWQSSQTSIADFRKRLSSPVRGSETLADFMAMKKGAQDDLKDVGGFVGGALNGPRRKAINVTGRDIITLDADNIPAGQMDDIRRRVSGLGLIADIYSTARHHAAAPRLRILIYLDRTVTADEYEPIARKMAGYIDPTLAIFDPTTFEVARLMYFPRCSLDSQYFYESYEGLFVSADGLLAQYADWRDMTLWPALPGIAAFTKLAVKQGDPEGKQGVVGAFCRTYDVYRAMDELIPGIYESVGNITDRYTYIGGSTIGGAVMYDGGKFLYSHHSTDPCGGKLVNAFDLVRLHRFADLDDAAQPGTPNNRLPSFAAMVSLATQDNNVSSLMAIEDFSGVENARSVDIEWAKQLTRDQNGVYHRTLNNVMLLIQNVPELNGCARRDDFSGRIYATEDLPWRTEKGYWSDADTTELRKYFETQFNGYRPGKQDVRDAIVASSVKQKFHPVRDYLNRLTWDGNTRLDTLFIDYLGVEDSEYARAVTRKALVGAVARVMTPGCKFDYMLVFIGKQGRGKSSIIYKLAGIEEWSTDSLVTFDGQKAFEAVTGKWLIEVPEMHAFDKVTMNQAKAFISKQSDFYRAAYAEFPEDRKRQCIFFGTTNNADCLRDDTGGRRFWPLTTDKAKRKKDLFTELAAERDQIWAEAVFYWKTGEPLYLSAELETIAAETQEVHREAHPWEDTIKNFVEQDIPDDWDSWEIHQRLAFWSGTATGDFRLVKRTKVCVREIWQEALNMGLAMLDQQKSRAISSTLNRLGGWQKGGSIRFGKVYGVQKGYTKTVTETPEN